MFLSAKNIWQLNLKYIYLYRKSVSYKETDRFCVIFSGHFFGLYGAVVNCISGILVPLFSGRAILVAGHWLTEVQEKGGGVLVAPDFSDEIVIHF